MAAVRGKMKALEYEDRMELNRMIDESETHATIIEWLESKGVSDVSPQNISAYKAGSWKAWKEHQERRARLTAHTEAARAYLRDHGPEGQEDLADYASLMAADHIAVSLQAFDPAALIDLMATKPSTFIDTVKALQSIRKADQDAIELQLKVDKAKAEVSELEAALAAGDRDPAELLQAVSSKMREILGV